MAVINGKEIPDELLQMFTIKPNAYMGSKDPNSGAFISATPGSIDTERFGSMQFPEGTNIDAARQEALKRMVAIHNQMMNQYPPESGIANIVGGVKEGLLNTGRGLKHFGLSIVDQEKANQYAKDTEAARKEYNKTSAGRSTEGAVAETATEMLPALAIGLLTKNPSLAKNIISGIGIGATQYNPSSSSTKNAMQGGVGAALGSAAGMINPRLASILSALAAKGTFQNQSGYQKYPYGDLGQYQNNN